MIYLFYILLVLIAELIQTTNVINFFTLLDQIQPNFILLVVVFINVQEKNPIIGEGSGFMIGLIEDFLSMGLFGLNAFLKTIVSFVVNIFKGKFYIEHFFFAFLFVFLVSLIHSLFYIALESVLVGNITFHQNFFQIALPGAVYNGVLFPLIFPFLKNIRKKIMSLKKEQ